MLEPTDQQDFYAAPLSSESDNLRLTFWGEPARGLSLIFAIVGGVLFALLSVTTFIFERYWPMRPGPVFWPIVIIPFLLSFASIGLATKARHTCFLFALLWGVPLYFSANAILRHPEAALFPGFWPAYLIDAFFVKSVLGMAVFSFAAIYKRKPIC